MLRLSKISDFIPNTGSKNPMQWPGLGVYWIGPIDSILTAVAGPIALVLPYLSQFGIHITDIDDFRPSIQIVDSDGHQYDFSDESTSCPISYKYVDVRPTDVITHDVVWKQCHQCPSNTNGDNPRPLCTPREVCGQCRWTL